MSSRWYIINFKDMGIMKRARDINDRPRECEDDQECNELCH